MKCYLLSFVILSLAGVLGGTNPQAAEVSEKVKPSVTVFPVVTAPRNQFPDDLAKRVGIGVATLLERAGLDDLEIADSVFHPPNTDDVNTIAEAFGTYVAEQQIKTDYAVFAQFVGAPEPDVEGIRTFVVDRSGKVLLADSAGKAEFEKASLHPQDPMSCSIFVGRRLQEFWQLEVPMRPNAPTGKMARFWKQDAGIPNQDELDAMAKRMETLKKNIKTATCTIYPIRVGKQSDKQSALELVAMLNQSEMCKAESSLTDPALKIAAHTNEQKVLWDTARAFRDFVKKNQPTTDYAVYADYGVFDGQAHYVHAIICDRAGNWVLIDMQNSHHPDFERIDPKSAADCNCLLLARINGWLSEQP